jgi:hypothetical protein
MGQLDSAIADYAHALLIIPALSLTTDGQSRRAADTCSLDRIIAELSRTIELAPFDTNAVARRGVALCLRGRGDAGQRDIERARILAGLLPCAPRSSTAVRVVLLTAGIVLLFAWLAGVVRATNQVK